MSAYTLGEVARICGVSRRRVRYWTRTALIRPPPESDRQPAFDFFDLVALRSVVGLLQQGVPLRRIRRSADDLRERFPGVDPWTGLRAWRDAPRVLLHHEGAWMEPDGQLVLDFVREEEPAGQLAPIVRLGGDAAHDAAREWFERGCALDVEKATWDEAADCYRRAIELDPSFADAHCNLGSVFFNRGRRDAAREAFERAIEAVPRHVEAHLNLGTLHEEDGADERALAHYRQALESDPLFPDVHVSMALIYEKLGLLRTSRVHWRRYLQLAPEGSWSRLARKRLEDAEP